MSHCSRIYGSDHLFGPTTYFSERNDWSEINRKAIDNAHGRVLDIGCGAGRFSLDLQQNGHEVVGVDNSPLAVKVCRERGLKDIREISVYDMGDSLGVFDTVIMMGNNLSLLASPEKGRELLEKLAKITSEEALIIGESNNVYQTEKKEHHVF
ncbi:class I SAM-dependent methyltransferase [bacterium]|nr:class I SAM-dependent methyltransferase [bacterium]